MCTKTVKRTIAVIAAVLVATAVTAQERREVPAFRTYGQPASLEDRTAIDMLIERYKTSWGRQDTEAFAALHAADTEWINAYARMFQDADSLAAFLENRLFPAFDAEVSRQEARNMRTISVRYLGDDAAVVHMYTEGARGASRNDDEALRRTHVHLVLAKLDGGWKIVHTAIMDAR